MLGVGAVTNERQALQQAIAALDVQRAILGDEVVEASLEALRARLAELEKTPGGEPARKEQHKQVTVLFADLSGFTALSENLDAEDVNDLINSLWQRLDSCILDQGGSIDKHIGDAVMALWGVGVAREDDPERAVRAALAMQAEAAQFKAPQPGALHIEMPSGHLAGIPADWQPALRVGIHTGMALLGQVGTTGEYTAMGDTVNTASRLEQIAPLDGVLISQQTYQQVRGLFEGERRTPVEVKGKRQALTTYRVLRAQARSFWTERRGVEGLQTGLVGRADHLQQLQDALRQVVQHGSLQRLLVLGEAGLGKSRLLQEFERSLLVLPEAPLILRARADEMYQGLPFGFIRDLFTLHYAIQESLSQAEAREKLERGLLADLGSQALEQAHFIGHMLGFDFSASPYLAAVLQEARDIRSRAFFYSSQWLQALSARGPVVFLLEDIHWADEASLDWLSFLTQHCAGQPALVIGAARPEIFQRRPAWETDTIKLALQPLSAADSQRLAQDILQRVERLPASLLEALIAQADGNPFYLEELVKMLIDAGVIQPGPQSWAFDAARLGALPVPSTLTGLLQARLDGLPEDAGRAIQAAAVVGPVFWDDALAYLDVGAGPPRSALRPALSQLSRRELIFPSPVSAFTASQEYHFKHALLRQVAYERVLKTARRAYHRRAAEWLVERSRDRANEFAALIAEHFERAGEAEQAAEWFARAGQAARAAYDLEAAIRHFQKSLELIGAAAGPEQRVPILEGLGGALRVQMHFIEAFDIFQRLLLEAQQAGNVGAQIRANMNLWMICWASNQIEHMLHFAEQAEKLARFHPQISPDERAWALWGKGNVLYRFGRQAEAIALAEESLAIASQAGIKARIADNYNLLALVYSARGALRRSQEYYETSMQIWRELNHRLFEASVLGNLGENLRMQGDFQAALDCYRQALELNRRVGILDTADITMMNVGAVLVNLGQYSAAIEQLELARNPRPALLPMYGEWYAIYSLACLGTGDTEQALRRAQEAVEQSGQQASPLDQGLAWRVLGEVASRLGQAVTSTQGPGAQAFSAAECFERSLGVYQQAGYPVFSAVTQWRWAMHEARRGHAARAAELEAQARQVFSDLDLPLWLHWMNVNLAVVT